MGKLKIYLHLLKLIKLQFHLKTHLRRNGKMGFGNIWNSHPKKYGQGSRSCRACSNGHGLIRKYGLNMCRQCFHQYAKDIGFKKWIEAAEFQSAESGKGWSPIQRHRSRSGNGGGKDGLLYLRTFSFVIAVNILSRFLSRNVSS